MLVDVLPDLEIALVDLRDQNVIALSDISTYVSLPSSGYYSLQITPPGYPTISPSFTPSSVNVFKCVDLGITCSDSGCTKLPDGIYAVSYTVIPQPTQTFTQTSITKKFIKIDQIKCAYQHAFLMIDLKCECHDHEQRAYKEQLRRIKLYIDGSVAACNESNYVLSKELYQKAEFLLNSLACKFGPRFNNGCGCGNATASNPFSLGGCNCK